MVKEGPDHKLVSAPDGTRRTGDEREHYGAARLPGARASRPQEPEGLSAPRGPAANRRNARSEAGDQAARTRDRAASRCRANSTP